MADTPISGFSSGAPAQSGDEFVIARSGANYKLTAANMKTFTIGAGSVSIASGKTLTTNNTLTLSGTDGSTLNIGTGGTLGALATVAAGTGVAAAAANAVNGSGGFITYSTYAPAIGKTLTVNNTLTLSGTDGTTMTFPSTSTTIAGLGIANSFTTSQNITPTSDVISLALRRNGSAQTNNILEIQTEANAFLAGFDKAGLLTLGAATRQTGIVKFAGTTSGVVSLSVADAAGTWTMKLPTTAGTNGYVLQTDGSGNTSWVAQSGGGGGSPGGSNTQVQFNNSGAFGGSANLTWVSPALTIGAQQTTRGQIVLANTAAGAFSTTVQSSNSASTAWTLTLPVSAGTSGQLLQTDGSGNTSWATQTSAIGYTIDGSGSVITTGIIGAGIRVPYAGTITSVTLLADVSGSVKIDILKDTYANYIFTTGSICASALPALSSAAKYEDTTLTGWTKSFSAGDIFRFKVDSSVTPSSIKNLAIILNVTK